MLILTFYCDFKGNLVLKFRKNFNCCKTVACKNFGMVESDDYIHQSRRLGYLSIECKACGSNPPWINNALVYKVFEEKLEHQFGRKLTGCHHCNGHFFITEKAGFKLFGFTSAGTQRKKCDLCRTIYTVPNYKNSDVLKLVLSTLTVKGETKELIKKTGLSARLYYFYLEKLALIFSNFSRLAEEKVINRSYLALHTEGRVFHFDHQRGIYLLITSEVKSGYILLQSNNLTRKKLTEKDIYNGIENTVVVTKESNNIENALLDRYEQNLKRKHFEQLLVGELKPITKCHLIYPDKLAYIHFQLLNLFTCKAKKYSFYIDHESTLRAGALMAAYPDIKEGNADVYFFLPFKGSSEKLIGKGLGWWKDKWFSNELGAYCPITEPIKGYEEFALRDSNSVALFYGYLNQYLNKNVNSINVIDNLLDIHRVIFNYCVAKNGVTRAQVLGVTDKVYNTDLLLDDALKAIMAE